LGRTHLLCLNEVFSLEEVRVVDLFPEAAEQFVQELAADTGLSLQAVPKAETAVRGADIIITVTTGSAINVQLPWLKPGAFIARMGSYQEIALDLILQADKLIVDRWQYVSYRVPEIIELIQQGKLDESSIHAEWPKIAAGRVAGRETNDEIILYIALGIWGEYAAILPQVYRRAKELGLGKYPTA
jgi:ornithine cyclodeaminase/alanine dehydrogenase-like protein (mu-crystallin family)